MKFLPLLLTGLLVPGGWLCAQTTESLTPDFLGRIRAEAARQNPAGTAARLRALAARQDTRSVRLWEDPMLGFTAMSAEKSMRRDEGDLKLMVEQKLPKPGRYQAEQDRLQALARAEEGKARDAELALSAEAAKTAIELALSDESLRIQEQQLHWLGEMVENARQRLTLPDSNSAEVLRMEAEQAQEEQMLASNQRMRESLGQKLNLLLGHDLNHPWPRFSLPDKSLPVPVAESELARVPRTNPTVKAMQEMATAAQAETRMAKIERKPELSLSAETRGYSAGEYRSTEIGLRISLPWFNDPAYQAGIHAAQTREQAAQKDISAMTLEVRTRVLEAITTAKNAGLQADQYTHTVSTKAELAAGATQSAWISSKATLAELLDSRRFLLTTQLEGRRLLAEQFAALEDLQSLVPSP
jgi:outer membrane protein, heavy metal efflux system